MPEILVAEDNSADVYLIREALSEHRVTESEAKLAELQNYLDSYVRGFAIRAESGIDGPAAAAHLATAGYHAVLVGETLMRSSDRAAAVAALRSCAALRS